MTTLTLREQYEIAAYNDQHAHVPHFLEPSGETTGVSVSVRNANDLEYTEKWVGARAYISEAECATPFETSLYRDNKDAEFLAIMNEPDPIAVHSADDWADFNDVSEFGIAA